jgi:hypothetical protein
MQLNGNLKLNTQGNSEIQNAVIERVATLPTAIASEKGRIVFKTDEATYYYNNGLQYMAFATGGNAAALQSEVDALELALGSSIAADGSFVAGQFSGYAANAASVTEAINMIESALSLHNTLAELDDVTLTSAASTDFLKYDGSKWVNHVPVLANISDVTSTALEVNQLHTSGAVLADFVKLHAVTSTAAELNILTGATLSTTELNYVTGVTSSIQTQLDNKQPLDAQLTSIAGQTPAANQVLVGLADGTYTLQSDAGFRSTQGLVIGTDIQAWDADLDTLAAFTPAADSSETLVVNGVSVDRAGQNDIMVATGGAEGSRWTLKRGASARSSLGLGDIAVLDENMFVRADNAGNSNIAVDLSLNNYKLVNVAPGVAGTDAINVNQLEAAVTGLFWKEAVVAATSANVTLSGEQTIDDVALVAGQRVLVKSQTVAAENGIYVVDAAAWVRAADFNDAAEFQGSAVLVEQGTQFALSAWTEVAAVATVDTDAVDFVQFNGAAGVVPGVGLSKVGNQLDINLGAGIVELPSDEVGIDLYDPSSSAIILTTDAASRSTATNAKLHLLLDQNGNGKLEQSIAGLKVSANTITEAELTASVAGDGLVGGNGSAIAVVSAAGTAAAGLDNVANWSGIGTLEVLANSVGVVLGSTSTTAAPGNHTHKADVITFDNAVSGLVAVNVQDAIDQVEARVDTLESNGSNLLAEVNAVEAAVGLNTDGSFSAFAGTNYLDGTSTIKAAEVALDTAVKALDDQINAKVNKMYNLYSGASSNTHVVTHNIGQKYVNVTIADSNDEVIIPQSIVFDSANQLTVTLNVAIAVKVITMGLA